MALPAALFRFQFRAFQHEDRQDHRPIKIVQKIPNFERSYS